MFTGLIESVGEVVELRTIDAGFRLQIATGIAADLAHGESIAVNGVCLTVVETSARSFAAEIGPETARVTSLGALQEGSLVNLERAMPAAGRFGGHLVLGHVDGAGVVRAIVDEAEFRWFTVSFEPALAPYLIHRGSIAVDGISLTIARLGPETFEVQIVPFTLAHTSLRSLREGDRVNLECDMVGKYVVRAMELHRP